MKIFRFKKDLQQFLHSSKNKRAKIGFVPTMGALHEGHISLIESSKKDNKITVCSIFVNPTQFNDPADFDKYPRTIGNDIYLLARAECDVVFIPSVEEMYDNTVVLKPDLQGLDTKLEGAFRPGHFEGVVKIVYLLCDAVKPHNLYMGLKDFQQQAIIQAMITSLSLPIQLKAIPTMREPSGLALSSRNMRLSPQDRQDASVIYKTLVKIKDELTAGHDVNTVLSSAVQLLSMEHTEVEYIKLCNANTLDEISTFVPGQSVVLLIAIWWRGVRLIDNWVF